MRIQNDINSSGGGETSPGGKYRCLTQASQINSPMAKLAESCAKVSLAQSVVGLAIMAPPRL